MRPSLRTMLLATLLGLSLTAAIAAPELPPETPPAPPPNLNHSSHPQSASLFSEVTAQRQIQEQAAALLVKALAPFPDKLLVTQIPDQRPHILENRQNGVKAEWTIIIGFNFQEYYSNVAPQLAQAFGTVARRRIAAPTVSNALPKQSLPGSKPDPNRMLEVVSGTRQYPTPLFIALNHANDGTLHRQGEFAVALNTATSPGTESLTWNLFVLDEALYPLLSVYSNANPRLRINFRTSSGEIVKSEELPLRDVLRGQVWQQAPWLVLAQWPTAADAMSYRLSKTQESNTRRFVTIAPFVRTSGGAYTDKYQMKYSTTFTESEIQRIASVDCSVVRESEGGK